MEALPQAALMAQYPALKAGLRAECLRLNSLARRRKPAAARLAAEAELKAAYAAVDESALLGQALSDAELAERYERVAAAVEEWRASVRAGARDEAARARLGAIAAGEAPQPAFTRAAREPRLQPPAALRDARSGRLVTAPRERAAVMARAWAGVSAAPEIDADALEEVLEALRAGGQRPPPAAAAALGRADVSEAEVEAALRRAAAGKAPGPDGLPAELWQLVAPQLTAVLARVFSAVGAMRATPAGFTLGTLVTLPKPGGDPVAPLDQRPITLLNVDYRLLASVLAERLEGVLRSIVPAAQTAFLRGRHMGENVMLMQAAVALGALEGCGVAGASGGCAPGRAGGRGRAPRPSWRASSPPP
jgi:hypothetical protein